MCPTARVVFRAAGVYFRYLTNELSFNKVNAELGLPEALYLRCIFSYYMVAQKQMFPKHKQGGLQIMNIVKWVGVTRYRYLSSWYLTVFPAAKSISRG